MKSSAANTTARDEVARAEGAAGHGDHARRAKGRVAPTLALVKAPPSIEDLVGALGAADRRHLAAALITLGGKLLEPAKGEADQPPTVGEWHVDVDLVESGYFASLRVLRETVSRGELRASRSSGRTLVIEHAELTRYLEARVVKPRPRKAEPAKGQGPAADPLDEALEAAGLRRVAR